MAVELGTDILPIPLRESTFDVFSGIAKMAALLGCQMNLATFVTIQPEGTSSLQTRIVRGIGKPKSLYFTPAEINAGLDAFLDSLTGQGGGRSTLAWTMLADSPKEVVSEAGRLLRRWQWPTTNEQVLLGVEEVRDDKGVSTTIYVQGVKHNNRHIISRILKTIGI